MRGPPRPGTRMHVAEQDVLALLHLSQVLVEKAEVGLDDLVSSLKVLHKAEQVRLLVRLAADSGARRGELAALKFGDLNGRGAHHRAGRVRGADRPHQDQADSQTHPGQDHRRAVAGQRSDLVSAGRRCSIRRVGLLSGHRPPTAPHGRCHGPLVRRAVCGGRSGRGQSPPAAPFCGHVPGRPGRAPAGPTPARSSRSVDDAAELRPRPSASRTVRWLMTSTSCWAQPLTHL